MISTLPTHGKTIGEAINDIITLWIIVQKLNQFLDFYRRCMTSIVISGDGTDAVDRTGRRIDHRTVGGTVV